jgi:hypothetical protein
LIAQTPTSTSSVTGGDEEAEEAPNTQVVKVIKTEDAKAIKMKKKELANNTKEIQE